MIELLLSVPYWFTDLHIETSHILTSPLGVLSGPVQALISIFLAAISPFLYTLLTTSLVQPKLD